MYSVSVFSPGKRWLILDCIRRWRNHEDKPDDTMAEGYVVLSLQSNHSVHKTCPICRSHSDYVVPSMKFHLHGTPEKEAERRRYLEKTGKIPCKFFTRSSPSARFCPFGNDCHFAHKVNGTRYLFSNRQLETFRLRKAQRARQRQREAMLEGLLATEPFGMDENEALVWDVLQGLMEHEEEVGGGFGGLHFHGPGDYIYGFHDEFGDSDSYVPSEDEVDDDDDDEELLDLPPLLDDDLPPLVGDDDSGDDDSDDMPGLLSDHEDNPPEARTREGWGPTDAQNDASNRQPQIQINGHQAQTNQAPRTTRQHNAPTFTPRTPPGPTPRVTRSMFQAAGPAQFFLPPGPPSPASGVSPRHRRFSPPQHTPPPGPRRPRPPHSRHRDTSRPRPPPRGARQPLVHDELAWEDEDGTTETDGEISEREKQKIREREERGINARNWASRSSDLSFFRS